VPLAQRRVRAVEARRRAAGRRVRHRRILVARLLHRRRQVRQQRGARVELRAVGERVHAQRVAAAQADAHPLAAEPGGEARGEGRQGVGELGVLEGGGDQLEHLGAPRVAGVATRQGVEPRAAHPQPLDPGRRLGLLGVGDLEGHRARARAGQRQRQAQRAERRAGLRRARLDQGAPLGQRGPGQRHEPGRRRRRLGPDGDPGASPSAAGRTSTPRTTRGSIPHCSASQLASVASIVVGCRPAGLLRRAALPS
jgi:hypothetical protein